MNETEGMNNYCLCPRVQPKGTFMPSISFINPIHTSLHDRPSLQIHIFNLPKINEKAIISTEISHLPCSTKFTVKSMTLLDCTIQNRGVRCVCVCIRLGASQQIFMAHFKFFNTNFFEILFYFYNQIYRAQNNSFCESKIINHTYFYKCDQISIISQS